MRNAGLRQARGLVVLFLEAGARIVASDLQGWLASHRRGYVMVASRQEPAKDSALATAAFHFQSQDGSAVQTAGELPYPPGSCSYARLVLHETGGFPEGLADYDVEAMNRELFRRGYRAWFDPSLQVTFPFDPTGLFHFLATMFASGQAKARRKLRPNQQTGRLLSAPMINPFRARQRSRPLSGCLEDNGTADWRVKALVMAGHSAVMVGAMAEGVGAWRRGDLQLRQPRPQMILWVGFAEQRATALLIQCDYFQRRLTAVPVSPDLRLRIDDRRKDVSLRNLHPIYRSLSQTALRSALEEAIGLDGLGYLIGAEDDLNLILCPTGGQVQIPPDAERHFVESMQVGRLVSSLQHRDIGLLQRALG
jgi:hypothetical protein